MSESRVRTKIRRHSNLFLCNGQEIVPVDTLVVTALVVVADPAGVDHVPASRIGFRVEQVVTFGAEMERCHLSVV